ncbi:general substrate transporter [Glonium stellatum]|uniref:Quinate transporter n=1 Tax=Glonium stellatum TaxID=574774 RepID=A0A8E2EZ50_9PEZI|nr:general substrate transporter [Glonium stellatum]
MANEGSYRNLYLAAVVACLTGALFGYSVGFIGGILVLPSFLHHFRLDSLPPDSLASATSGTVTIWLVGALIGVPLGMPVCSRWRRRRCLSFCSTLYVLGTALQMVNVNGSLRVFDAGRLLNGVGVGAGTLVSPVYISEISPPSERGMLLSGYQTAVQLAALAGFWAAFAAHSILSNSSALQWQIPVAVQLLPGVLLLLGTIIISESPKFLAEKGLLLSAEDALSWLRALPKEHPDVLEEVEELREDSQALEMLDAPERSFFRELRDRSVRRRLSVGVGLMIAQNMVGLNALNYYAPTIFMSAGFTSVSSSLFLTGLFGVIKVLSATSFMFVFVRLRSNRFWLQFGSVVCGISMLVLTYCVRRMPAPGRHNPEASKLTADGIVSVLMVYIFAFAFGISLGPLSWNICSEIFPSHIKAKCCAITTCVQWLFQIVVAGVTPHLLASIGWATYLLYAGCCAVSLVWVLFYVPETKGVPLGRAMDDLFSQLGKAPQAECIEEVDETTGLLSRRQRSIGRRDSIGFPV